MTNTESRVLLRRFRDPIWVPRIENRDPTGPYRVPNISLSKNPAKCIEYKHTVCTMQIGKNRHNRTIHSEFGGRTTGLQTLF